MSEETCEGNSLLSHDSTALFLPELDLHAFHDACVRESNEIDEIEWSGRANVPGPQGSRKLREGQEKAGRLARSLPGP